MQIKARHLKDTCWSHNPLSANIQILKNSKWSSDDSSCSSNSGSNLLTAWSSIPATLTWNNGVQISNSPHLEFWRTNPFFFPIFPRTSLLFHLAASKSFKYAAWEENLGSERDSAYLQLGLSYPCQCVRMSIRRARHQFVSGRGVDVENRVSNWSVTVDERHRSVVDHADESNTHVDPLSVEVHEAEGPDHSQRNSSRTDPRHWKEALQYRTSIEAE